MPFFKNKMTCIYTNRGQKLQRPQITFVCAAILILMHAVNASKLQTWTTTRHIIFFGDKRVLVVESGNQNQWLACTYPCRIRRRRWEWHWISSLGTPLISLIFSKRNKPLSISGSSSRFLFFLFFLYFP